MVRRMTYLCLLLLGACTTPPKDAALQGNANGVVISYVGDINATLPLAQQHCARYERVPVLHGTGDNRAIYLCVPRGAAS